MPHTPLTNSGKEKEEHDTRECDCDYCAWLKARFESEFEDNQD